MLRQVEGHDQQIINGAIIANGSAAGIGATLFMRFIERTDKNNPPYRFSETHGYNEIPIKFGRPLNLAVRNRLLGGVSHMQLTRSE